MQRFKSQPLLPNLLAGLIVGLVTLIYGISCTALIFSGTLAPFFAQGLVSTLVGTIVVVIVVALQSPLPFTVAGPDPRSAVLLGAMASAIANNLQTVNPAAILPTVWTTIAVSTAATGICLFILGRLHLGRLARFIPYPVMGGFLAGTDWLIAKSSFKVMAGISLELSNFSQVVKIDTLQHWLPGLFFALLLIGILKRYHHYLVLPSVTFGAIATFHLVWVVANQLFGRINSQGWFFEPSSSGTLAQTWSLSLITQANWATVAQQSGAMLSLIVIVVISTLLNTTGTEIAVQRDIDLDQELQANGTANLLAGLCGGIVGNTSVNRSLLNYKAGATYPLSAFVIAGTCGAVLLFGSTFLSYFPKSIFGGLLLYLGLSLLVEWIYSAWFKLSRLDYGLVIGILIIIAGWNFLAGVGAGVVISCFIFIFNYSRNPVIKYTLSGALHQSNVGRSPQQQRLLHREGDQIYILTLQGFIFFGTANTLLEQVRQRLQDSNLSELRFLVLDFRLVNGLDSSAVLSFVKIKQLAQKQDFYLVFTALQPIIQQQLKLGECLEPQDTICQLFPDFDRGIEWCENQILETVPWRRRQSLPLALQLDEWFPNTDYIAELMDYLEEIDVEAGQFLFRQGEQADSLFIIESGQVSILLTRDSHQDLRVQTSGSGSLVGEMDMFLKQPHPMSAIADVSSTVYCLSSKALSQMQREAPQAAIAFQEAINSLLAERLSQTYQEIDRLLH
jgi:SulP family sulfate permease